MASWSQTFTPDIVLWVVVRANWSGNCFNVIAFESYVY